MVIGSVRMESSIFCEQMKTKNNVVQIEVEKCEQQGCYLV
jgi:hypothetical protein